MRDALFQILDSVLPYRSAAYAAGPLDTGRLYYASLSDSNVPLMSIRQTNEERLSRFVDQLRSRLQYPVIDPGILRVDGWTGKDYGGFFVEVIRRYAREIWLVEGWEFSSGASKEFIFCQTLGLPCFNHRGESMDSAAGRRLILEAAEFIEQIGGDSSKLRSRVASLAKMDADTSQP